LSAEEHQQAEDPGHGRGEGRTNLGNHDANQDNPEQQTQQPTYQKRSLFKRFIDSFKSYRFRQGVADPKTYFEIAAFVVVVCYTVYAGRQSRTMSETLVEIKKQTGYAETSATGATDSAKAARDAVTQARDQFRQDQRPYIWLTNSGLGTPEFILTRPNEVPPTGQILWTFHYTNYGKSPAYKLRSYKFISVERNGRFSASYGSSKAPSSEGVPVPPNKDDMGTVVSDPGITQAAFNQMTRVDNAIRIKVRLEYSDAYGGKYETAICIGRLVVGSIQYCPSGNDIK
jgi:hypothetical protein